MAVAGADMSDSGSGVETVIPRAMNGLVLDEAFQARGILPLPGYQPSPGAFVNTRSCPTPATQGDD